ncbi:carboxymuconolactone decarboxylase family protein [Caulobacter segnis]|uniref:Alkyl hydroperoxide reductase AhpD n=1 Tax=Caulobacter segnis TaxID=88688 RepID=A0A2W5UUA6_9CAUL|nr:carboxymuconolactone decarboxylase family protein [Caulobacter segnis]PZR30552.1 MAG: alkyl hydroperoxide reductase [Caulobacter segnis]
MSIEALRAALPAYARDIATNLSVLAAETVLSDQARWGCFVASAHAAGEGSTLGALEAAALAAGLSAEALDGAKTASAAMAMTNVYFRALHLMEASEYRDLPSRLRMNRLSRPGVSAVDHELWALAASAINGCGACLDHHEAELRRRGATPVQIQAALRIAAVVNAVSRVRAAESLASPQK